MADIRIKVAKDKAEFLKLLRATEDTPGPFQSYADVLVFAAALGVKRGVREPITEYSRSIDPIRQDIFDSKGYNQVINLLAVTSSNNPKILASTNQAEEERIKIFEEYANAGLEILARALKGSVDYTESLLIFLSKEREPEDNQEEEFDLSRFIDL
ncbi:MAG: DNA phosphorothioation-associated protein 4 [Cyanobacteriota bacterium]